MDSWVPRATRLARCTILRCLVPHTQTQLYGCTVYCISGEAGPARRADRLDAGRLRDDGGAQDLGVKSHGAERAAASHMQCTCACHSRHLRAQSVLYPLFMLCNRVFLFMCNGLCEDTAHWPVLCSLHPERAVVARAQHIRETSPLTSVSCVT